jgi:hypothetical protein
MREHHAAQTLTSRRTIESEDYPCQNVYRGKLGSPRRLSNPETWGERCGNELKTAAGAAVFIAVRCTIVMHAAESGMLR